MPTKTKMEYVGTHGLTDNLAQTLMTELEEVTIEQGASDAPAILEWTKIHPEADWHHQLIWDNEMLGDFARCTQIRRILGYIRVKASDQSIALRGIVSLRRAPEVNSEIEPPVQYVPRTQVLSKKESKERYVIEVCRRIIGNARELEDMQDTFPWLPSFVAKINTVSRKLDRI